MIETHQYDGMTHVNGVQHHACTCGAKATLQTRMDDHIAYYTQQSEKATGLAAGGVVPGPVTVRMSEKDREMFKALMIANPGEKVTKKADVVDMVNHPSHYTRKIEVLDFVEAYGLHHFAYLKDAVKYIARHQFKGSPLQDLKKARFYLDRHIKNLEAEGVTE